MSMRTTAAALAAWFGMGGPILGEKIIGSNVDHGFRGWPGDARARGRKKYRLKLAVRKQEARARRKAWEASKRSPRKKVAA